MAQVIAVGPGPVRFTTADGVQIDVPLWEIVFADDGTVSTTGLHDSPELERWLAYLQAAGRISPGTAPARIALELVAATPGAYGNNISITTATVQPATEPRKADMTVEVTDRYPDLTVDGLVHLDDLLGTSAKEGSKPGLLQVKDTIPADVALPAEGDKPGAGAPVTWSIAAGSGGKELVLEPADPGSAFDRGTTTVTVEEAAAHSITLVITWSAKVTNLKDDDPIGKLDPFGFLVTVGGNPPPAKVTLPVDGTVVLSGGADPADARSAKANLLAAD